MLSKNNLKIILIFLVFALAVGLRSVEVLNKNFLFGFDQGRDYLDVSQMVLEGKPRLIGSQTGGNISGIFNGPYYYYSLIIPFLLFQGDPYGGLVLMFVFGVASLFVCFFFARQYFGLTMALITVFLIGLALSAQSRFMWNPHPSTFFILLAFWFTYKIVTKAPKYFFLATFTAGLIYGFDLAVSTPLILAQFLYVFFILKRRDLKTYLYGLLGVILSHLPFFAFEVRHGFMATKGFVKILVSFGEERVYTFFELIKVHLFDFWFNFRSTFILSYRLQFFLLICMLTAARDYLRKAKKSPEKYFISFLLFLPLAYFIFYMMLDDVVWGHYLVSLHVAYCFLFAFFFIRAKRPLLKIAFPLFLILMLPSVVSEIKRAQVDYYDHGGTGKIKGKIETIDYLYQDAAGEEFNLLVFTPPVYDYPYRYLLQWYGQKKYGYLPGEEKKGLFYLWIEQDGAKPWSYKGWLQTVIKTGEVQEEVTLPNGFIIQKRYAQEE